MNCLIHPLLIVIHGSLNRVDMRAMTAVATRENPISVHLLPSGLSPSAPDFHRIGLFNSRTVPTDP
jgi:hypothetical protein